MIPVPPATNTRMTLTFLIPGSALSHETAPPIGDIEVSAYVICR
jgi:hypothetical protein